ncbi:hypothetical protein BDZ91DRAFT_183088 [Kalaharituber pfeilii]|nr:hypothetical protein BDZ91DRAFT_183088 [Kalaharituber pfeilii]
MCPAIRRRSSFCAGAHIDSSWLRVNTLDNFSERLREAETRVVFCAHHDLTTPIGSRWNPPVTPNSGSASQPVGRMMQSKLANNGSIGALLILSWGHHFHLNHKTKRLMSSKALLERIFTRFQAKYLMVRHETKVSSFAESPGVTQGPVGIGARYHIGNMELGRVIT